MNTKSKFNWSRLKSTHPNAYSSEQLFDYMLHFASTEQQQYEKSELIKKEIHDRHRAFKSPAKVKGSNIRDTDSLSARKRLIEDQIKYMHAFPERPDSRTEMLFMDFKLNTTDGIAMCSVDKIEIRGEFVWYFVTQTVMKTSGEVATKKAQHGSNMVELAGFDFIPFRFSPTKAMDKRHGWLTWNFDILFDGTAFPQVITRTDIDLDNIKGKKEESKIKKQVHRNKKP